MEAALVEGCGESFQAVFGDLVCMWVFSIRWGY